MEKDSDNNGDNVHHRGKKTQGNEWWCRNAKQPSKIYTANVANTPKKPVLHKTLNVILLSTTTLSFIL